MQYIEPIVSRPDMEGQNVSYADVNKLESLFAETPISERIRLTLRRALVGKVEVENYESVAVSRMTIAGDVVLVLADGYALNVTNLLGDIRELL